MTAAGTPLDLSCLSSGEQHELVLLHELLFELRPGSLILIDEPELSLHVTWQAALLEELLDIAELVGLDFVLATHSPYIIGAHDALMVQLGPSAEAAP
jgi:predicted ATPase